MDDFKQQLIKFLWAKFFVDIDQIVKGLEAYGDESRSNFDFETLVSEDYDRIGLIVEHIEHRCPLFECASGDQPELRRLCEEITQTHIELRLQRDAIWQAHLKGVSEERYRAVFLRATREFFECGKRARAALNAVINHLASVQKRVEIAPENTTDEHEKNDE